MTATQLSDASHIDLSTTLLGQRIEWPVMLSPTGASKLFHADGEAGVARAAARFGTIYSLSTLGTTTIEDAASASKGPKLFQLYMFRDRGLSEELIRRSKEAGYVALCLTVATQSRARLRLRFFGVAPIATAAGCELPASSDVAEARAGR